jgi:hypothetical protein
MNKVRMNFCKTIGCNNEVDVMKDLDFCNKCLNKPASNDLQFNPSSDTKTASEQQQSSGGDNEYWIAHVSHPKRLEPYMAECEDLIELFQMTFQEGEAFKALWRKGQMRIGKGKPGDTLIRNSEKVYHFGGRMVAMES